MIRIFVLLLVTFTLQAEKSSQINYHLYDLGTADQLSEQLPPRLNNNGLVIANRNEGALTWQKDQQEYCPKIPHAKVLFYALNNRNDVLVSTKYANKPLEWAVWPSGSQCNERQRETVDARPYRKKSKKLCLNYLSDSKTVAGCFINHHGESQPVVLNNKNNELHGIYQGMTSSGTIYGFLGQDSEVSPAIWSESTGLVSLKNYSSKIVPEGIIRLETLAMTDEGVVYGTYWVEYKDANPIILGVPKMYYNFAWQPSTGAFKLIDIDGMRVAKTNACHTLVGTLNGKPALCDGGKKPVEFSLLLDADQRDEWEIIHISDINDSNQLVGLGKYQGNLHLFFAERR